MKKRLAGILTAVVVLGLGTTSVFAAGRGFNHTDAGKGSICDSVYTDCPTMDRDRVCGDPGTCSDTDRCGREFNDDDGDGVCDNYSSLNHHQSRTGHGCQKGHESRHTRF